MKNWVFILCLASSLFGAEKHAKSSDRDKNATENLAELCQKPTKVLCGSELPDPSGTRPQYDQLVDSFFVGEKSRYSPDQINEFFGSVMDHPIPGDVISRYAKYIEHLKKSVPKFDGTFDQLKKEYLEWLDTTDSFNGPQKRHMVSTIKNLELEVLPEVKWETVTEAGKEVQRPTRESYRALTQFAFHCGPPGLGDNASYSEGRVSICPGMLLTWQSGGTDLLEMSRHVISHEFSHALEFRPPPMMAMAGFSPMEPGMDPFESLLSCHYEKDRVATAKSPHQTRSLAEFKMKRIAGEIIADSTAIEVMIPSLEAAAKRGRSEAFKKLKTAVSLLCGTPPDDIHPHPHYRIEELIFSHPKVAQIFGCPGPTEEKPACTLKGKVTKALGESE